MRAGWWRPPTCSWAWTEPRRASAGPEVGGPLRRGLGQRLAGVLGVVVLAVDRGSGLLAPGLLQRAAVDRVEAELVDQVEDGLLGRAVGAGDRQRDPPGGAGRHALLHQVL